MFEVGEGVVCGERGGGEDEGVFLGEEAVAKQLCEVDGGCGEEDASVANIDKVGVFGVIGAEQGVGVEFELCGALCEAFGEFGGASEAL